MQNFLTVEDYLLNQPMPTRNMLVAIRKLILGLAPNAQQKMAYGIPTITLNGRNLIHFAGYQSHIGLYPGSNAIEVYKEELKDYKTSKGTIQFPLDKPLPLPLISQIVLWCIASNQQKNKASGVK